MKNTAPDRVPNCENFAINFINLEYKKIQQNLAIFFYNIVIMVMDDSNIKKISFSSGKCVHR